MAVPARKTRLTNLDTKGVAVVTAGANNKRFAFAKGKDGLMPDTIEKLFLMAIEKGDMPLDEKAVEDMCAGAGLDPQMIETVKAIMKLKHVYRDSAAFAGVLKQLMTSNEAAAAEAAPGTETKPGEGQDETVDAPAEEEKPAFEPEGKGEDEGKNYPEGTSEEDEEKEPPMSDKDEAKKMADLIAKATADADKKVADAEKKVTELEAIAKTQKEALDVNTAAVKKMQDDLRLSQWVSKAERELAFIPSKTADELGKMLFEIDTLNADMAKSQFELLKGQAAVIKGSNMFRPSGATGGAPAGATNAWAEAQKRAADIVSKSAKVESAEVAEARAIDAVFKADPVLYKRYCDEQQSINRASFN